MAFAITVMALLVVLIGVMAWLLDHDDDDWSDYS